MTTFQQALGRSELTQLKLPVFNFNSALSNARVVMISDTHMLHRSLYALPEGDILIHAGDITEFATRQQLCDFTDWISRFPHPIKIIIAGNHDDLFTGKKRYGGTQNPFTPDIAREVCARAGVLYLQDQELDLGGIRIHGTPWQPDYKDLAFNIKDPERRREIFSKITPVDILVTHVPAYGILDVNEEGLNAGCKVLREEIPRINPKLHVAGHIHTAYGMKPVDGRMHVNASSVNGKMQLVNPPLVYDLKV